ncbi:MAG TPA: hypothetical protein VGH33_06295 [Isosphaeraceae bacterium]|jgi:hypothetical protein
MAVRLLLVGLVIGLGFDLPSGDEVASWAVAGTAWVQARVDGLLGPEAVAEPRPAPDAEFAAIVDDMVLAFAAEPKPDVAFSAIVDDMAANFADETARVAAPRVDPAPRRLVAFEPLDVPDDLETGVAFALNRDSQGVGVTPEPIAADRAKVALSPSGPTVPGRPERLASAVRLTGQAAAAWMAVLRGSGASVAVR